MKSAVTPPRTSSVSQKSVDATRHARCRSPFSSSSLNTGTNAPESAASARSARTTFGMRIATVNALMSPVTPKKYALTISRTRPSTREIPSRARRRPSSARSGGCCGRARRRLRMSVSSPSRAAILPVGSATIARPAAAGIFSNGEHQATEEARPDPGAAADREPPLPIDDQDADEAPRGRRLRRRRRARRHRSSRARPDDRPGVGTRRASREHGCAQEVSRCAARRDDRTPPSSRAAARCGTRLAG